MKELPVENMLKQLNYSQKASFLERLWFFKKTLSLNYIQTISTSENNMKNIFAINLNQFHISNRK